MWGEVEAPSMAGVVESPQTVRARVGPIGVRQQLEGNDVQADPIVCRGEEYEHEYQVLAAFICELDRLSVFGPPLEFVKPAEKVVDLRNYKAQTDKVANYCFLMFAGDILLPEFLIFW